MKRRLLAWIGPILIAAGCGSTPEGGNDQPLPVATPPPAVWACAEFLSLTAIPDISLEGCSGGEVFEISSVVVQPGYGNPWDIFLCEHELEDELGPWPAGRLINIELDAEPETGAVFRRTKKPGGGFFLVRAKGPLGEYLTRDTMNSWIIEFVEWDVDPYDPEEAPAQEAGSAEIRIAACFAAEDEIGDSGVAGEFDDVLVRYLGRPD